jgi:EmrB/QacA subfamily drug resistance transporter
MTASAPDRPRQRAIVLTACGGTFLAMLDSTVTNLAVPDLQRAFPESSVPDLSWVVSGYAILFAALLAPAGRMADALGRRRLFATGVVVFTVASLVCALAPVLPVLVAARFVQGAGAAAMIPAALAILLLDGPEGKRAGSIALWSTAGAAAAALGPSVGGVLVEQFGWPSVFVINVPLGVLVLVAVRRVLPPTPPAEDARVPDPVGTVLLALGVGGLTVAVTQGPAWGWVDARTVVAAVVGALSLVVSILRSRRHDVPAVDTTLWSNRTFAATNVVSLFYGMAQFAWMLGSVLYLTEVWGYTELEAGLANTPGAFFAAAAALGLARITAKIGGPRGATLIGLTAFTACGLWFSIGLIDHAAFLAFWLPASFLAGGGMGAATMGTSSAAAMSAPPTKFAGSSGLNTTARQFGGALGIAIMAAVLALSTAPDGTRDVDAYRTMFAYCTAMVAIALVVAAVAMRFPPPALAAVPTARAGSAKS